MNPQVFAVDSSSQEGNASPVADMEVAPEHENGDTAAVLLQFFEEAASQGSDIGSPMCSWGQRLFAVPIWQ